MNWISLGPSVPSDAHPHDSGSKVQLMMGDAELLQSSRPGGLDEDVRRVQQRAQPRPVNRGIEIQRDALLTGVQPVVELLVPSASAVRPANALHLDHGHRRTPRSVSRADPPTHADVSLRGF